MSDMILVLHHSVAINAKVLAIKMHWFLRAFLSLSLSVFHPFFLLAFGQCLKLLVSLSALIDHDCSKPLLFGLQPAFHKYILSIFLN
jgi:hypothetical protein